MLSAKDVMVSPAITVTPDETVEEVAHKFLDHHISGMPVVDPSGRLLGVVTECALLDMVNDPKLSRNVVSHYMTRDVVWVDVDQTLSEAVSQIVDHGIRRLPVTSEGHVVGIISRREIIRRACEDLTRRNEHDWLRRLEAVV